MYTLRIGCIEEPYPTIDNALNDCFTLFPEAMPDGDWKSNNIETWMNIQTSNINNIILGKIIEVI